MMQGQQTDDRYNGMMIQAGVVVSLNTLRIYQRSQDVSLCCYTSFVLYPTNLMAYTPTINLSRQ